MTHSVPYVEPATVPKVRVIVALTMLNGRLVRTIRFRNPRYIGDPINAVKIFSDKGADELVLLETCSRAFDELRAPVIRDIASEALMPISYGGGIRTMDHVRSVIRSGFEKVVLNTALHEDIGLAARAAAEYGSQAVVASIEIGTGWLRRKGLRTKCGRRSVALSPAKWAQRCEEAGCGELLVTSIDHDGLMAGYDLDSIRSVADAVSIPVIALGGARDTTDFSAATGAGASAVAAGSMFVFHGPRRAVLINYPEPTGTASAPESA